MIIACDIDGVVANIMEELCYLLWQEEGIKTTVEEFTRYKIEKIFNIDDKWLSRHFAQPHFWLNSKPYEDGWHMINKWFSEGHDIYFVTGRWNDTTEVTLRWLNEWDIPFNDIYLNQNKGHKWETVKKINADLMIEDRLSEARALDENNISTFLINRPWNTVGDVMDTEIIRVDDMYNIDRWIK